MDDFRKIPQSPSDDLGSAEMGDDGKTTIRLDEGLKGDARRCADERRIPLAEFIRQAVAHYVAWCAAQKEREGDDKSPRD